MTYLQNHRIRLRALEPEDLELLYTLENDPASWDVSNSNVPYSRFQLRQYIENAQADIYADCQLRLIIERTTDGTALGTIDLDEFSPHHRRGDVGIALLRTYRGEGYAGDALTLLKEYAFGFLHLQQLTAHIATDHEVSLRLFRQAGFTDCGVLRRWWRAGSEWKDVAVLQCLG